MIPWTYKMYNGIGLSIRADLYLNGEYTGFRSPQCCSAAQTEEMAQDVCDALNQAEILDFRDILSISYENGVISVEMRGIFGNLVYYWHKTPKIAKNSATF